MNTLQLKFEGPVELQMQAIQDLMSHFAISDTKTIDTEHTSTDNNGNEVITTTSEVVKKTPAEINSEITLAFGLQDIMKKEAKKRAEAKAEGEIQAINERVAKEVEESSIKIV